MPHNYWWHKEDEMQGSKTQAKAQKAMKGKAARANKGKGGKSAVEGPRTTHRLAEPPSAK